MNITLHFPGFAVLFFRVFTLLFAERKKKIQMMSTPAEFQNLSLQLQQRVGTRWRSSSSSASGCCRHERDAAAAASCCATLRFWFLRVQPCRGHVALDFPSFLYSWSERRVSKQPSESFSATSNLAGLERESSFSITVIKQEQNWGTHRGPERTEAGVEHQLVSMVKRPPPSVLLALQQQQLQGHEPATQADCGWNSRSS